MFEWSGDRVEDGKPAQALSSLAKVSEGRDDGRRVFKKQKAKEAFLGKAELQRAVLHPCSAILHPIRGTRGMLASARGGQTGASSTASSLLTGKR
jgi:hypothetical protein